MAEDKPATQAERIAALEEEVSTLKTKTSELDAWGDDVQAWIDNRADADEAHARKVSELDTRYQNDQTLRENKSTDIEDRIANFDNALRLLLDDRFGKNVRPAGFDDSTRIPDPADPDHPANSPELVQETNDATEPDAPNERLDALESKLDRLLDALSKKD